MDTPDSTPLLRSPDIDWQPKPQTGTYSVVPTDWIQSHPRIAALLAGLRSRVWKLLPLLPRSLHERQL